MCNESYQHQQVVNFKNPIIKRLNPLFSLFFGNTFVFFAFDTKTENAIIDSSTRTLVFSVLTGVGVLGVICMLFLRTPGYAVKI